jgi:tRNA threonylcarbamoyladenosine biosynthesis protein TsaB
MSLILNIDTATETASIALAREANVLLLRENPEQKDHAGWIHQAIRELLAASGHGLKDLQAVAVTSGPGSYTGLRVGMATAKGLCYALGIPLLTESTLKVMASAASGLGDALLCPMIDARRMEVFTGVYDRYLSEIVAPGPMVLDASSFIGLLSERPVAFFGSGSSKFRQLISHENAQFPDVHHQAGHLAALSHIKFRAGAFTDPAYAEPVYLKEFHTHTKK